MLYGFITVVFIICTCTLLGLEDIGKDAIQEESYFILLQPKLYEQIDD